MRKIMIFGAKGMAGHMIYNYLKETNKYTLYPVSHKAQSSQEIAVDIEDLPQVEQIIQQLQPNLIINAIGILNDKSERNRPLTAYVNTFFPKFLEWIGQKDNMKIIHISTDCVFSGEKGAYTEFDEKDEKNMYGLSKNFGEVLNLKDLTIRTSIIGPELKDGKGLFHWFMKQKGKVQGYTRVFWSGVTTLELARAIEDAIDQEITGLYHLTNSQKISKFELLKLFQKYFKLSHITLVEEVSTQCDKSIQCARIGWDFQVQTYEEMVEAMRKWMIEHPGLYTQYQL